MDDLSDKAAKEKDGDHDQAYLDLLPIPSQ